MATLKTGEIVQLKSGGPKMTVKDSDTIGGEIHCQWFAGSKLDEGWFPIASLVKVEDEAKPDKKK